MSAVRRLVWRWRRRRPLRPPAPYFVPRSGTFVEDGQQVTYEHGQRVER